MSSPATNSSPNERELEDSLLRLSLSSGAIVAENVVNGDQVGTSNDRDGPGQGGIQSLPRDVLEHIFLLTLPEWNEVLPHPAFSDTLLQTREPWTLVPVCKHWRDTALGYKRLWSRIRVDLNSLDVRKPPTGELNVLKLCLRRSYPAPMTIYLIDHLGRDGHTLSPLFLEELILHSTRWAKFYTYLSYQHFELLDQIRHKIPMLEELHIWPYVANALKDIKTFEDAPSLKRVVYPQISNPGIFHFPSHQFVSLDVQMRHARDPIHFLHGTTSLQELIFSNTWSVGNITDHPAMEHRVLRRLVTDSLDSLLEVEMPNLQTLIIDYPSVGKRNTTTPLSIAMFALRSRFQLSRLSLVEVRYRDRTSIVELFKSLASLTHLQILGKENTDVPWDIISSILTISTDNHLLPNLMYLDFQSTQRAFMEREGPSGPLMQMLVSRLHQGTFAARFIGLEWPELSKQRGVLLRKVQGVIPRSAKVEVMEEVVQLPKGITPLVAIGLKIFALWRFMTAYEGGDSVTLRFNEFPPRLHTW